MGQGLYQAIVFGVFDPDIYETDADGYSDTAEWYAEAEAKAEKKYKVHFLGAYEAEPAYHGVVLAVSDGCLAINWKVPEIPDRKAVPLDDLEIFLRKLTAKRAAKAISAWEDIRDAASKADKTLPAGRLLYVSDWH